MIVEKSAGALVFYPGEEPEFLLLKYPSISQEGEPHWDFPKGNIEEGEDPRQTAQREVEEETGISEFKILPGFKETQKFFYRREGDLVMKFVTFFLARTETKKAKKSWEHEDLVWLPYKEAVEKVTFKSSKEILRKANKFLKETPTQKELV